MPRFDTEYWPGLPDQHLPGDPIAGFNGTNAVDVVAIVNSMLDGAALTTSTEVFTDVTGVVTPTVLDRASIDIASTAGAWSLNLADMPQDHPATIYVKIDSSGSHTPTFPSTVVWDGGSAPSGTLWAVGKRAVIRFTRVPFTAQIEAKLVASGDTPDTNDTTVVDPPDLTFEYSTSAARTGLTTLAAATLPYEPVAIVVGPLDSDIKYVDLWYSHTGALPAVGSESTVDSYVGRRSTYPYDFLGSDGSNAVLWDTATDPTGNNRTSMTSVIDARVTYIDDTTAEYDATFTLTAPPTADALDITYGNNSGYVGASPSTNVTVPTATDRALVAIFLYRADKEMTGATLGGNAMTVLDSRYDSVSDNGTLVASIVEASMPAAGTRALVPTYSGSIGAISVLHAHYWIIEGAVDAAFTSSAPVFNNATANVVLSLTTPDASLPVFTAASHQTAAGTLTDDWDGTSETQLVTNDSYDMSSRAEWKLDSGVAGAKTVTFTPSATKSMGAMVYLAATVDAVTPVTPGTPTLTTPTKPADNQLATTWTATADAVSYEGRIGTTNPPTTSVISLGDVTSWTRSGLLPSTLYYMQVRAVSSTDTRSAWSTAVSGTTNASTVVVEPVTSFVHGYYADLNTLTHTAGDSINNTHRTDGVLVPNWHGHINLGPAFSNIQYACKTVSVEYANAINRWAQNSAARPASITDIGPRTYLTFKLAWAGSHYKTPQPSNAVLAVLDLARSGSTGTDNRNAGWRQIGVDLAGWGHDVFISLSHESPGYWYSNFSGINTALINNASLLSVPDSQFGAAMGAAVRAVAVDGNIAAVHKLAAEHAATEIRTGNSPTSNAKICYTLSDAASVPPNASGSFSSAWQDAAHPDPEYFDVLAVTTYCRGGGRPIYKGTGSVDDTASYTFRFDGLNSAAWQKAQEWNRPIGWWELGCNWDVFDWPPTYTDGPTDNQSNIFWKYASEFIPAMDVAFISYWHSGSDRAVGSTYQLPEANYGYQKTSGTTPAFPKTLNQLRAIY